MIRIVIVQRIIAGSKKCYKKFILVANKKCYKKKTFVAKEKCYKKKMFVASHCYRVLQEKNVCSKHCYALKI